MLLGNLFEQDGQSRAFTLSVARRVELDILVAKILVYRLGILWKRHARKKLLCRFRSVRRPQSDPVGEDEAGRKGVVHRTPCVFIAGLPGPPGPRQVDQVNRVFVRQENALKPGLAIERRLVCPGAGAVDQHHRMPARSARNEPLGEAVIAGLDIGGIVGHRHGRAAEGPCAHALDLDDFFGSGPALRKGVGTRRDGQQECGREQNRMVRHDDPPRVERGSADMFVQSVAVLV